VLGYVRKISAISLLFVVLSMLAYAPAAFADNSTAVLVSLYGTLAEALLIVAVVYQLSIPRQRLVVSLFYGLGLVFSWLVGCFLAAVDIDLVAFNLVVLGIPVVATTIGILAASRVKRT
jgi:hypothetical protein